MTKEHKEMLDVVKATYAHASHSGKETGIYTTAGMAVLITLLEEQEEKLGCVAEDLKQLYDVLMFGENWHAGAEMARSTLTLLGKEDSIEKI